MKALIFIIILFFIPTSYAQITNGDFETGSFNPFSMAGQGSGSKNAIVGSAFENTGTYGCQIYILSGYTPPCTMYIYQQTDFTGQDYLNFDIRVIETNHTAYIKIYRITGGETLYYNSFPAVAPYTTYQVDLTGYGFSGNDFLAVEVGTSKSSVEIYLDNLYFTDTELPSTLSGYVTNNLGNSVTAATITLNNSGGSTTSNDTGYYEITSIESGTYTITATSPTHVDYSDTVSITADTEKNITMTRLSPLLTWTDAETTKNDVFLKWRRNAVVDNVRIYKDTETRLLTTVSSGSTLAGLYSDRNLDCDKGYVYWLQPMDNDVAGPKYRIDAKTDPCDGGGGGGPTATPTSSPTPTPRPTVSPEEWVNLTLDERILAKMLMFPPLLEFKWEDIYVWGIHLFLILCGIVALDSITIQRISEYTGLWAILPGVMFAYLTGYLII